MKPLTELSEVRLLHRQKDTAYFGGIKTAREDYGRLSEDVFFFSADEALDGNKSSNDMEFRPLASGSSLKMLAELRISAVFGTVSTASTDTACLCFIFASAGPQFADIHELAMKNRAKNVSKKKDIFCKIVQSFVLFELKYLRICSLF